MKARNSLVTDHSTVLAITKVITYQPLIHLRLNYDLMTIRKGRLTISKSG